ncbi:hypothetical protein LTS09_015507 [Friedmanniomyces endolithicus]|nr:hypothetical protein LTS09_015507 [Friedmanniomyces endolithicus]
MNRRTFTVFAESTARSPAVPATSTSTALYTPPSAPTATARIGAPGSPYQPMRPTTPERGPGQAKEPKRSSWLSRSFGSFSTPSDRSPNKLRKRRPDKPPDTPPPPPPPSPSVEDGSTASRKKQRRSISVWLAARDANDAVASNPTKTTSEATLPGPVDKGGPAERDEGSQTVVAASSQAPVPKPKPRIMLNDPNKPYLYPTPSTLHTRAQSPDRIPLPEEFRRVSTPQASRSSLTLHHWMQNSAAVSDSDFIPVLPEIDESADNSNWQKPWTSADERSPGPNVPLPLFARLQARQEPERGDLGQLRRSAARRGKQQAESSGTASQRHSAVDSLAGNRPAQGWRQVNYGSAEGGNPQEVLGGFAAGRPSSRFLVSTSGQGPRYYEFPIPQLQSEVGYQRRYPGPTRQSTPHHLPHQRGPAATSAWQRHDRAASREARIAKSQALARERENYIPYRPPPVMVREPVTLADPVLDRYRGQIVDFHADQSGGPQTESHEGAEGSSMDDARSFENGNAVTETTRLPGAVGASESATGKACDVDERTAQARASSERDILPRLRRCRSAPAKIDSEGVKQRIKSLVLADQHQSVQDQAPRKTLLQSGEPVLEIVSNDLVAIWSTRPVFTSESEDPEGNDPRGIKARHACEVEDAISKLPEMRMEYRSSSQKIVLAAVDGQERERTSSEYSVTHASVSSRSFKDGVGVVVVEEGGSSPTEVEGDVGVVDDISAVPDVVAAKASSSTKPATGAAEQGQRTARGSLWERRIGARLIGSPVTQLFDMLRNPYWDHHW